MLSTEVPEHSNCHIYSYTIDEKAYEAAQDAAVWI